MRMVYLLWLGDDQERHLEEIFAYKIDAEKCLREFQEQDKINGRVFYHYWIQEKEVK
jgi:hypothetical protein